MIDILFEKNNSRVIALDNGKIIGECNYILVNDNTWNIIHTGVRNEYQGQGIARKLIECVIENANDLNKKVIAECSYAKKVINNDLKNIVKQYLEVFPEEKERQNMINDYLSSTSDPFDWDDFNGHLVAGGIIYAEKEKKFLMLEHRDLDMFLHPGGHIDKTDKNVLFAAKREIREETGLDNLNIVSLSDDELIPFDIDTHYVEVNQRLNLPAHYHFEFRYLFKLEEIIEIIIDKSESRSFKWISLEELEKDEKYNIIVNKIKSLNIL